VIDIIPAYEDETAIRIELFDDEVENILYFDRKSGEIIGLDETVAIYPAKYFVTSEERQEKAIRDIRKELNERVIELNNEGKIVEAQRLEQRTNFDLEMIQEVGYCTGIENYSRHMDQREPGSRPSCLFDYFPRDYLLIVDESHSSVPQINGMYNGDRVRKQTLIDYGFRLPSALDNRPMKFEEWESMVNQVIFVSATPAEYELQKSGGVYVEQIIRPTGLLDPAIEVRPTKTQIDDLIHEIRERSKKGVSQALPRYPQPLLPGGGGAALRRGRLPPRRPGPGVRGWLRGPSPQGAGPARDPRRARRRPGEER
jgi:excinuclease ABC subunit B